MDYRSWINIYLGKDMSQYRSWDAHIGKVIQKGEALVGKMNAIVILTDSYLL